VRAGGGEAEEALDLKRPEWRLFSSGRALSTSPIIHLRPVAVPRGFERWIERVVLVEKHLEARALVGFTRIESTGDIFDLDQLPQERRGPLARHPPRWVPGVRMRGEGIFVQFREEAVAAWERGDRVQARETQLRRALGHWCAERGALHELAETWEKQAPDLGERELTAALVALREAGRREAPPEIAWSGPTSKTFRYRTTQELIQEMIDRELRASAPHHQEQSR
jgi:hypothetical protein